MTIRLSAANTQLPALLNVPVIENNALGSAYPYGTGPYRYGDGYTSLVQVADHPDAASMPVDTIYLKEYDCMEDVINAFDDELLDLALNDPTSDVDLSFSSVNETRQYSTTNLQYVGFNTNSSFFLNSSYRAALRCVVDRAYAVSLLGDAAVATALPVHPVSSLYNEQIAAAMEYDLDACREALDRCKVVDYDGDGKREFLGDRCAGYPPDLPGVQRQRAEDQHGEKDCRGSGEPWPSGHGEGARLERLLRCAVRRKV